MKLTVRFNTAGSYGSYDQGNMISIVEYLSQILSKKFNSAFEEMSIDISYPPMYIPKGIVNLIDDYRAYYSTLPLSRIERKNGQIAVVLKGPEFSEYFQVKEAPNYSIRYDVDDKYRGIETIQLVNVLLDKCIEAVDLLEPHLLKEDSFDIAQFISIVEELREKITPHFIDEIAEQQAEQLREQRLKYAKDLRKMRKENRKTVTKPVQDVRVYAKQDVFDAIKPYAHYYSVIVENKLQENGFLCPTYDHLYIRIGKTKEDALLETPIQEPYYVNGIAVIDFDEFVNLKSEFEKEQKVFDLIAHGLRDIAKIDGLDTKILEKTIKEIQVGGLNTELKYKECENSKYHLQISYQVNPVRGKGAPLYFNITNKWTNKVSKQFISYFDSRHMEELFLLFDKVSITNKEVRVEASTSIVANVHLKGKPREMIFDLENLL